MGLQESLGEPAAIAAAETAAVISKWREALADHEFLAGSYSFADIAFYMAQFFGRAHGAPMTNATPRLPGMAEEDDFGGKRFVRCRADGGLMSCPSARFRFRV